jgi:5S rRNA maturation endonuclease (ribonuclease M5)|tara:strand:- start:1068 stop:1457 length:390 start_codon:yes stop_codon:yes gene_type:complete
LNREKRYDLAYRALEEAIEENEAGSVVLVEGRRDEIALRALGFTGPIEKLNRGWPVEKIIAYIDEKYESCILLMDWDRTGGRLQKKIVESMTGLEINVSDELRQVLSKAMKPDTRCVEDLTSFLGQDDP